MTIEGDDPSFGTYLLESPRCIYNHETQQLRGDGVLKLTGPDSLEIYGIGYDFYWKDQQDGLRLVIRDAVKIQFQIDAVKKWSSSPKENALPTIPTK